jgi:acetyl-CoA acetyltransferase
VAIEEDDRVKLTTRLVDATEDGGFTEIGDVDRPQLGQQVRVLFDHIEDVYLPIFTATGEGGITPLPADEEPVEKASQFLRPMLTPEHKYESSAAITGIGMSDIGRRLMRDPLSLTVDACLAAIEDAGLKLEDIDGMSTYPGSSAAGMGEGGVTALEGALRIRPNWYNGGGETFGPGGSVMAAVMAVHAGLAKHVLCFRTLWQSTHEQLSREGRLPIGSNRMGGMTEWITPFGASSAAHVLGMTAQRHMAKYGTTRETLGWIALNARHNAGLNPKAIYRDPMTMDDYLSARMITTPFGLYDCDIPCDAGLAVIVSAIEPAADLRHTPIGFEAIGTQMTERVEWDQSTTTHEPQVFGPATHLWTRSSLTPADVDVALLYDGFSFNCLSWLEGLGFCGIGEAKDFLDGGKNIALDGIIPLNTHGGQLSAGRTHGMGFVLEAVTQLRGDGGDRQVKDGVMLLTNNS